jgi:hypothetical protein
MSARSHPGSLGARPLPTIEQALAVVGIELQQLLDQGGSMLTAGNPYLVGSLAFGLGNQGSDVDIHLVQPDGTAYGMPFLFFVNGEVAVDLEHYPAAVVAKVLDAYRVSSAITTRFGTVARVAPSDRAVEKQLTRWLCALPLRPDSPALVNDADAPMLRAVLVRAAFDKLILLAALARLADAADEADDGGAARTHSAARYLWQRAGRQIIELFCRTNGDIETGEKWLPARAARVGLPVEVVKAGYRTATREEFERRCGEFAFPVGDAWELTVVRPEPAATVVALGAERMLLTRHRRVYPQWIDVVGTLHDAIAVAGPARLLRAIDAAQLTIDMHAPAVEELLCR